MSNLSLKALISNQKLEKKTLLFAYIASRDCIMHLKFVFLELQSPFRAVKIEITTTDGYIAEQGLAQPKSKYHLVVFHLTRVFILKNTGTI